MKSKAWMTGLKHWRWMPGMLDAETGLRVVKAGTDKDPRVGLGSLNDFILYYPDMLKGHYPDLSDPATLGCLVALVREAAEPQRAPGDWPVVCTYQNAAKKWGVGAWLNESGKATFAALVLPSFLSEAEALLAALEAL